MNQHATPCLALQLDAFESNVQHLAEVIVRRGGKRWRPHVKSIRSPALARRLLAAGAQGVTCATVREAHAMVDAGFDDVLVASPVAQRADMQLLARLNRHAQVSVAFDSAQHLHMLSEVAQEQGVTLPVLLEVEVGLERSGANAGADAAALARQACHTPQLRFAGLMAWEGHAARIGDPVAKALAVEAAVGKLLDTARHCEAAGASVEIVSCSGTGTFEIASLLPGVTEIQAGGGVFGDLRYREDFGVPALRCALTLWATVLARPTPRRIVCDAGWKSLAVYPKPPRPIGLGTVDALAHAAEHLSLTLAQDASTPCVGDRIAFEVGYADATTFLHRQILGFRGDEIEAIFDLHPAH